MNRLGVLVLSLVGAGISLFVLSVLSHRPVPEAEIASRPAADGGEGPADSVGARGPGVASRERRGAVAPRGAARGPEGGGFSTEERGRGASREEGAEVGARAPAAPGETASQQAVGRRGSSSAGAGRRGELVDFLARGGPAGGESVHRGAARSSGKSTTVGGWEEAVKGEGEPADLDGDGVVDEEEAREDVVLSVPLDEGGAESASTEPIIDEGLEVEESGVEFPADSVLAFPDAGNMRGEAGTITFEVEPKWSGTDPGDNSFVQVRSPGEWQGKVSLFRNGRYLRFVWFDTNGQEQGVGVDIGDWQAGDRHEVTATWGEALLSLYVDGKLAGQNTYSGELAIPPGTPLFLGSNPRHHVPGADATLQNFKVYGRALSPEEVRGGVPSSAGAPKSTN